MAYHVYVCCNGCLRSGPFGWTNITVSLSKAKRTVKMYGWKVTKEGAWYCPECQENFKNKVKNNGMGSDR